MAFALPSRKLAWRAGGTLLGAALLGAAAAGAWVVAALILAAGGALLIAQLPEPPARPFIGPMKRRATDFLKFERKASILPHTGLQDRLRADLEATQPFLDTLCGQIEGVQQDVIDGVMSVVQQVEAINRQSAGQRERIAHSLSGVDAMREAVAVPGAIIARLSAMIAERDAAIAGNYTGLETLAREFQDLRTAVDVISQVADKAFFLAINASVEAHRQGAAGLAFGLIATEMRALATQTAEGARQVGQSINCFAERMQMQIIAAMPDRSAEGSGEVLATVRELERAQQEVAAISQQLAGVMEIMEAGHGEMVMSLSDILGRLQFQDVMKQRLGQVADALAALKDLAAQSAMGQPNPPSVRDLLEAQSASYVMESQKRVHAQFGGSAVAAGAAAPKIELF